MKKINLETKSDNENLTYFEYRGKKYQVKLGRIASLTVTIEGDEVQCVQKEDRSYLAWRPGGNISWNR